MTKDTSGPAFSCEYTYPNPGVGPRTGVEQGMTMRDYYAAAALPTCTGAPKQRSREAYEVADAMIEARKS